MIDFILSADFSNVDATMGRLMRVLNPGVIHSLASRIAKSQILDKYESRFGSQVDATSGWQEWKRSFDMLPFGGKPGFFTSSTYRAISSRSDGSSGEVYLKGRYPSVDSDIAGLMPFVGSTSHEVGGVIKNIQTCLKWADGGRIEFTGYLGPVNERIGAAKTGYNYIDSMGRFPRRYGAGAGKNIKWMFLDGQDIDAIADSIEQMFDSAARNDIAGIKAAFRKKPSEREDSDTEAGEAVAASVAAVQPDPRVARVEKYFNMPIGDILEDQAVRSVDELVEKLQREIARKKTEDPSNIYRKLGQRVYDENDEGDD